MTKVIWHISKYTRTPDKDFFGNRGWDLMKNFALKGYKSVVITSDSLPNYNLLKLNCRYKKFYEDDVCVIIVKTLQYANPKSIKRVLSWFSFESNFQLYQEI